MRALALKLLRFQLIDDIFVNDIPQLKKGGKLCLLVVTAAARIIGAYKVFICDVSVDNGIVSRIMNALRDSKINDAMVPITDGPHWNAVLHEWSCKIEAYVKSKNTVMVPENVLLIQQLSGALSMSHRLEKKSDKMSELMQDRTLAFSLCKRICSYRMLLLISSMRRINSYDVSWQL